jgi:thiamine pyrophosphokinase
MKCVIVSGGVSPSKADLLKQINDSDIIIAVDGAADLFDRYKLSPHYIIGDIDTADPKSVLKLEMGGSSIIRLQTAKNETDTEAAVNHALKLEASDIVILGATGRRMDHALANLAMLVRAQRAGVRCRIIDKYNEMWVVTGEHRFSGRIGQTVSIHPLTGDLVVNARNLKYPLDNLALRTDSSRGISNVIEKNPVQLSISGGFALIVKIRVKA